MVSVKFGLVVSVLLVIGCVGLSSARRPYFSDEEDALENIDEEETSLAEEDTQSRYERSHPEYEREEISQQDNHNSHQFGQNSRQLGQNSHPFGQNSHQEDTSHPEGQISYSQKSHSDRDISRPLENAYLEVENLPRPIRRLQPVHRQESLENSESETTEEEEVERRIEAPVTEEVIEVVKAVEPVPCTCGIFMTGQFHKASKTPPKGNPIVMNEMEDTFQCNPVGNKQCINKCLEILIKHLPNSPALICAAADRDIHKERAYLFVKNCKDEWVNSNLSAGREYCCQDNAMVKCPSR